MPTLQDALAEQRALRDDMEHLMQRMDANERLLQQLSAGGSGGPSAPVKGRDLFGGNRGGGAARGGGSPQTYGAPPPPAAMTYGAPPPPQGGGGGGRPQTAPPPGSLQAAYANRAPPSPQQVKKGRLTQAQLQSRRDEFNAAVAAAPAEDHWAEPGDKPSVATIDQTEKALKECFEKSRDFQKNPDNPVQALQMLFNRLDPNHSGKLDRKEFTNLSKALGFEADPKIMNSLFNRYDVDRSNTVDTAEFGKMLFKADGQSKALSTIGRIRECLALRAGGFETLKAISGQFRIGDRDHSGQLSKDEFDVVLDILLNAFKLRLSPAEKNNLFAFFDFDKSGGVSYDEFVREVRGPMNEFREHFVKMAFGILDKDGSGEVDARDLADAYDTSKNPAVASRKTSPQDCLNKFMESLGGHNGRVTLADFLEHYQWVSSNIDSDDYFELMMRNAWHMSGGEGWCANTSDLRVCVIHSNGSEEVVELQHDMGLPHDPSARYNEIVKRLKQQGVKDIKKVDLAGGC